MYSKQFKRRLPNESGFSLLEVLVTTAIIAIVTAIVLVRHAGFNNSILMKNQAYEVALAIREAQVFSVSVRSDTNAFRAPYGVYVGNLNDGTIQEVILFQDVGRTSDPNSPDGFYTPGSGIDPIIETLTLDSRFEIHDICYKSSPGDTPQCDGPTQAHITFNRPDFDAHFKIRASEFDVALAGPFAEVVLRLRGVGGSAVEREIWVSQSGLIAVK